MKKLSAVTAYAIAMGYLESAVVIYLREMAFGNTYHVFPIVILDSRLSLIEIGREAATILMLAMIGYLSGKDKLERWMYFIYAFAVWDVVYYVVLKLLVGWPSSFFTFDVLFLIPIMWIGPVIAPLLIALVLGTMSVSLLHFHERSHELSIRSRNIWLFIFGCLIDVYSFTARIFHILIMSGPRGLENYAPSTFDWVPFAIGYLIMCTAVFIMIRESYQKLRSLTPDST